MRDARYVHQPARLRVVGQARCGLSSSPSPGDRQRAAQVTGWLRVTAPSNADQAAETRAAPFDLAIEACGPRAGAGTRNHCAAGLRAGTYPGGASAGTRQGHFASLARLPAATLD
jgi:hypothetical protein